MVYVSFNNKTNKAMYVVKAIIKGEPVEFPYENFIFAKSKESFLNACNPNSAKLVREG